MENKRKYVKFVYKLGAIVDLYFTFALLIPELWAFTLRIDNFFPDISERLAIAAGASLMFGWTILLLWADRKPVQRRFILMLTFCPVITGFLLLIAYDLMSGHGDITKIGFVLGKLLVLSTLLITAFFTANQLNRERQEWKQKQI